MQGDYKTLKGCFEENKQQYPFTVYWNSSQIPKDKRKVTFVSTNAKGLFVPDDKHDMVNTKHFPEGFNLPAIHTEKFYLVVPTLLTDRPKVVNKEPPCVCSIAMLGSENNGGHNGDCQWLIWKRSNV